MEKPLSHGVSANWEYLSNCDPYVLICKSVGWLIHDDDKCKVIASLILQPLKEPKNKAGDMTIPAACVLRMVELKESTG